MNVKFDHTEETDADPDPSGHSAHSRAKSMAVLSGHGGLRDAEERRRVKHQEDVPRVIFPFSHKYWTWWGFTVVAAVFTIYFETYQIAFHRAGLEPDNSPSAIIEYVLVAIFVVDIIVNFNLAYTNEFDEIVYDRKEIAKNYLRRMFWVDLVGVFPFYLVFLAITGEKGEDSRTAQYLALLRLFKMVRLHRVVQLFNILQYSTKISFMTLTLTRNFSLALVWTHFAACVMYFISRQYGFSEEDTWIGGSLSGLNGFETYVTALYWSIVTFTTVGYGDYSPVNPAEQIWGMLYMLINIVFQSWVIGSITLLIVKQDEDTGAYRDMLQKLDQYCGVHNFDKKFYKRLKKQVKLDFNNREIADEEVLKTLPNSLRRRVLRRLYLPSLHNTSLMRGVRQQFVDAFLTTCKVELYSPGDEIMERGSISSDLYLLVEGTVKLQAFSNSKDSIRDSYTSNYASSIGDSELGTSLGQNSRQLESGDFINEIGFFTESPQIESVHSVTVCKTLTMPRSKYKQIAQDHPASAGKILQNLLDKVKKLAEEAGHVSVANLPKPIPVLRAGSIYDASTDDSSMHGGDVRDAVKAVQAETALAEVEDLVQMHINKQKDDHTTRFLFAASRGDTSTIGLMCGQGFDPDSSDYDQRTAMMVAAMKGNTDAVMKLLEFNANPNLVDMHGSSALYEAAKNGHDSTVDELLKHGADLCMEESQAASTLCQCVFDSDIVTLRRLLKAKIQVDAADYDKRAAVHIAAAEGNVLALKVLIEFGADLTLKDRWGNTIEDEAKRANAGPVLDFVKTIKKAPKPETPEVKTAPTEEVAEE